MYRANSVSEKYYYDIREEIRDLVHQRIKMALLLCNGNKTAAADMLGLPSYQTLTNWIIKYGVEYDR
jgi:DNA-binding protein Fis